MRRSLLALGIVLACAAPGDARAAVRCAPDAVAVGPTCVDRYEASVWRIPRGKRALVGQIQRGRVTLAKLLAAGAEQVGVFPVDTCRGDEYAPEWQPGGAGDGELYAVSVPGVVPSTCITWFQAEQACRLSGKRLLRNQDWQAAAAGTPDPGLADDGVATCSTFSPYAAPTGSRVTCVSSWGLHDMVGNAWEWIAEWGEVAGDCTVQPPEYGGDFACVGSATPEPEPLGVARVRELLPFEVLLPGGVIRGGNIGIEERAGAFAIYGGASPATQSRSIGFR
ncbi:MAG: SUMF1/EgtB/PvdO family nonheme iron enzyme, partial [Thermodesulfobacteriota bacterium]